MEEKILNARKNGMAVLLLTLLGYAASIALFVCSVLLLEDDRLLPGIPLLVLSIAYGIAGIFLFCGLKVLKPQEALVLTLFGDYVGTLKGQGFYWVNPFCERRSRPAERQRPEQPARLKQRKQKDLPEDDDPEQLPAED